MSRTEEPGSVRLLIIDDDLELCELLMRFLRDEGFEVDSANGGGPGADRALSGGYGLVLLDVMLGRANGFDVLRRIRARSAVPVLMLTAKGDAIDRILGLEIGADDYLAKPFNPQELAARVRAILRRTAWRPASVDRAIVTIDDLEIDPGARTVRIGATRVDLTTVEFDLLETLTGNAGHITSREDLTQRVLGRSYSPFDRSIDTHIYNLRRKLGPLANGHERIVGIRGTGYLYACSSRSS